MRATYPAALRHCLTLATSILLALWASPASADLIATLDDWNTTELQAIGDTVTVSTTSASNCGGGAAFCYAIDYVDADPASGPTAKAIILLGYTDTGADTAPSTQGVTGTTTTWDLNDSRNVSGFGVFEMVDDKGQGNETSLHFFLGTSAPLSDESSSFRYVAHVQYLGNCSGFVGTSAPRGASSNPNCGTDTVPAPGSAFLLGAGLAVVGFARRRSRQS